MSTKILSFLCYLIVSLIAKTMRFEFIGREIEERVKPKRSGILAFWHNRLSLFACVYKNENAYMMISQSRDGELVSRFAHHLGIHSIRGSTTRGGKTALKNMAKKLREGCHAVITPDGPKGPRYRAQPGTIYLGKISGAPIVPATCNVSRKMVFGSWDRFIFPLPFSKIVVIYGEPVVVPENADQKMIEEKRVELEKKLNEITKRADSYFE